MLQLEFEFLSRQTTKLNRSGNVNERMWPFQLRSFLNDSVLKIQIIRVFNNTIWNIAKDTYQHDASRCLCIFDQGEKYQKITMRKSNPNPLIMRSSSCWSIPSHWLGSVSFCNIDTKANAVTLVWRREATNTKTGFCGENCRIAFKVN